MATAPDIECEQHHAGLMVTDLAAAIDFYTAKLGFRLAFTWGDPPTMAGVNLGHVQIFLEVGEPAPRGCYVYFVIGDADRLYDFHRANGVEIAQPIGDRAYDLRDYTVRDLHGYHLSFGHRLAESRSDTIVEGIRVDDADSLLEACFAARTRAAVVEAENLPADFFDLSSGRAGAMLQKLRNYGVRLAVVCPPGFSFSERFAEMAAEERRRRHFGVFETASAARTWLQSH